MVSWALLYLCVVLLLSLTQNSVPVCPFLQQTGGVRPSLPSASLPAGPGLGAGLPPLRGQDTAAVSAAAEGRQVAHATLLPH